MAATITFLQLTKSGTNLTTYTYSSVNFGSASADRKIICAVNGQADDGGARTISSLTIGGVTATINVQISNSGSMQGICIASVPTGTSGDVVLTFSGGMGNADIALYSTTGVGSTTATDTGTSTAEVGTYALDVVAEGVALALSRNQDGIYTATWAGLTERYDEADGNTNDMSGASDAFATTQTNLTVSCTWSGVPSNPIFAVASFPPTANLANLKTYNTNLRANIKTINTNAIANVKTLNTNV